jgi:mono/diheme cytochrome c family protein
MIFRALVLGLIGLMLLAAILSPPQSAHAATLVPVDFTRDILPIFQKNCLRCHGAKKAKHGLRLDNRKDALGMTDSGRPMIIAGKPEASELIERIAANEEFDRMPPAKSGPRLTRQQVDLIRLWIQQGAKWPPGK